MIDHCSEDALLTDDGAVILVQTSGVRCGKKSVLNNLDNPNVTARDYSMRVTIKLESGDPRYQWLNRLVAVGVAERKGNSIAYNAYALN